MEELRAAAAWAALRLACSGLTVLSHRLMKQLIDVGATNVKGRPGNLVFSPLSIYSALSVVASGARGTTRSELHDVLSATRRGGLDDARGLARRALCSSALYGGPKVRHTSLVWHDATRRPKLAYRDAAADWAWCGVPRAVDFTDADQARKEINSWVAATTRDLIDSILPVPEQQEGLELKSEELDARSLMLSDAVSFQGRLERSFSSETAGSFHRLDGTAVDAQFICSTEDRQFVATHDGFKVLKMMYALRDPFHALPAKAMAALLDGQSTMPLLPSFPRHSMYVVLPDARDGLPSLLKHKILASRSTFLHEHLPETPVPVGEFRMPRLSISYATSVKHALQELGVHALFSAGAADLSDLLEPPPTFVVDMVHKALLEVREEFEVQPAKVARARTERPPPLDTEEERVDFVADHPFAFFVVEEVMT